jgi:hypothetical protein
LLKTAGGTTTGPTDTYFFGFGPCKARARWT